MKLIQEQKVYTFAYRSEYLQDIPRVSVHVKNGTVQQVMQQALKGLPLKYVMVGDGIITVCPDSAAIMRPKPALWAIDGQILDEAGESLDQVSVEASGSAAGTKSNDDGQFKISIKPHTKLTFSSVGYETVERLIKDETYLIVRLKKHLQDLDETVITGYGKTSKRYKTSSIDKVNQLDIARQPVSDPLATLQGRIPGLLITQSNGVPGSPYKIQLRGQSSIGIKPGSLPPNDPLFIINGVPYAPNNNPMQAVTSGTALGEFGRSPLSFINIGDIDHIEVLKDADATAIYGSRGSNGVILITTKKGKTGKPSFTVNIRSGFSRITRYPDMMNTAQYVQMRREALENDGLALNNTTAPDLMAWDTTRYTDFKDMFIGSTAVINDAQLALSGGSKRLQYYLGAGYHRETTVFPGDLRNERLSGHGNLHYQSRDSGLNATFTLLITGDKNRLLTTDLTSIVNLAPHTPVLYDSTGKLNWIEGDLTFINPMSSLLKTYESKTSNLLGNLDISYRILKNLLFKTSLGYNRLRMEDMSLLPGSSFNPYDFPNAKGYSYFGKLVYNSWIVEPQLEYNKYISIGKISGLLGATMQVQTQSVDNTEATNFASDAQLRNLHDAGSLINKDLKTEYRYGGVFARLNSILYDKYLINLTGRTDGSSRFGPGKQVGTFWSTGAGWIFSNEPFMKNKKSVVSFGKLRSSYGVTGNDQIGDYKYLDQWQDIVGAYLGTRGIIPVQLADSNYSWEVSRKLEAALDLGLFKDRLMISVAWYRNRTGNQLISYTLPGLTGFTSYAAKNSSALVQNSGWEIQLQTKNQLSKDWHWNGNILLTIPRNKLIAFPNLATSSYAHKLTIGRSLSTFNGYSYAGVHPATGLFSFNDLDEDGDISFPDDYRVIGHLDPSWYGSIQSNWQYKGWQLDVFLEIRKQQAYNYLYYLYNVNFPGKLLINQPALALDRWQRSPDHAVLQQNTTGEQEAASKAIEKFKESNGGFQDASYCRVRNVELSWRLPGQWLKNISLKNCRIYLQAQNLFTITRYKGTDPETQNLFTLPPLRTIAGGIELNF
ncbi:SusC/RagA family TonB-linked outer membrane protein [Longitalea arenae]|uniref:SusC/RagA family TonB-linked outer membrane protein n=1 Tax=Longitalea arenae TaxID=2812558 RepID=UPI0019672188|nr:SusC/RagA family TonB-linked outer membrane protein [Longitalea arenae]